MSMTLIGLSSIAEVVEKDNLAQIILCALKAEGIELENGDVVAIAQKIISKAEGRYVALDDVTPSTEAYELAEKADKDPRQAQLILDESAEIVRVRKGVVIVEHKNGYVHANAGIDKSNLQASEQEQVLLLPIDSDASACKLKAELDGTLGIDIGVLINDSAGRAWRVGTTGMTIGVAGFNPLVDLIGKADRSGRIMEVTQVAVADELASAASFLMGQADEGVPVVIIKGANLEMGDFDSKPLIRDKAMDMFR